MNKFYTDKQQIINWLDKYQIENYKLIQDKKYGFVVNVDGDVNLIDKKLINIPIRFGEVTGNFWCHSNKLTSLEFSPETVGNSFWCNGNQLTSLEFCPQNVDDSFYCDNNPELKEIQEITDFKLIYLEHKKTLITKFSDKLENELTEDESRKYARIKI